MNNQVIILLKKEWTEALREYKLIWLPLVFIAIGILQPVTMKLLPLMIGETNGLILDPNAPIPTGNEIFSGVFGQLNQLGIMMIALTLMGCIVKEEKSGILDILFSKPIRTGQYLASKYMSSMALLWFSCFVGSWAGVYYTNIYYSPVDTVLYLQAMLLYSFWFLFLISLGVTASAIANTQIQAAGLTVLIPAILLILANIPDPRLAVLLPSGLSQKAVITVTAGALPVHWYWNVFVTIVLTAGLWMLAYWRMRYKRRG